MWGVTVLQQQDLDGPAISHCCYLDVLTQDSTEVDIDYFLRDILHWQLGGKQTTTLCVIHCDFVLTVDRIVVSLPPESSFE